MKALDEYFLMVVFTLLLNTVHVFAIFMFGQRNMTLKEFITENVIMEHNLYCTVSDGSLR